MTHMDEEDIRTSESQPFIAHRESHVPYSISSYRDLVARIQFYVTAYTRQLHITSAARRLPSYCLPNLKSYLTPQQPQQNISRTEWLNGLRGLASLFVFWYHFAYYFHWAYRTRVAFAGGPRGGEQDNYWITQLPFIRLTSSGDAMVCIFYVLSGYSLSIRPISLMRDHAWDKLLTCLASSTWRRAGRLYLPCIIVTFICGVLLMQLGLYEYGREASNMEEMHVLWEGEPDRIPELKETLYDQFYDWYIAILKWHRPYEMAQQFMVYDPHLWTIPVEFRCSIVLFATQLGLCRMRTSLRILMTMALAWYCAFIVDQWEVVLFLAGFAIADLDAARNPPPRLASPNSEKDQQESQGGSLGKFFWSLILIAGMYLMSAPSTWQDNAPGYTTIFAIRDYYVDPVDSRANYRYPMMLGSIMFVHACTHLPSVRNMLSSASMRFLGRISFMFYLVQHPMNAIVGYRLVLGLRTLFVGSWNVEFVQKEWLFALALPIHTAIGMFIAELMTRGIDNNCMKFMRWAEKKCLVKTG